jgi:hypothetical protein
LAPVNRAAAERAMLSMRTVPARLLQYNPRLDVRLEGFAPRHVHRPFVGDHELRYEIKNGEIIIVRLWHTREDRLRPPLA